ncbi:pilus assembly protein [Paenibacillus sp. N3/727]|uniref:TadE/TadG family type IV pilus assembly protein n=1 Tax=Paenibacillus sp. N3/727 TaxID=2925845 RepID=UPI001F538112|nr:TadE family protein [Paenibacillus sp. N3/727]UNK17530.1 pilus assembly protein [Paenibacillus sp. N3/727]
MKRTMLMKLKRRREVPASEQGSMVVEASIVLPLFMFFVIFLIYIVQMTLISTALQSTVSDAVKTVTSHIYPVSLAVNKGNEDSGAEGKEGQASHWEIPKLSLKDWVSQYSSSLPSPLNQWVADAAAAGDEPLQQLKNQAAEAILDPVIKPILKPFMPKGLLDYDRIHVSNVSVPNLKSGENPYFGIEVSYELPIRVPFMNKKIVLQAKSQERLWIGDTGEGGGNGSNEGEGKEGSIQLLEKPDPAIASKQAKVKVKVEPGASANMSVYYKTGKSTAKYLGWKTADENGYIEWEWNVGFNTTPGTWPFIIETADGERLEVMFTVVERQ